ncbi:hypothetical protein WJ64_25030 [Burkholderia ubonensis]|nr:hypothetical protein WJ64_25030 [Burkholderia ubonensis]
MLIIVGRPFAVRRLQFDVRTVCDQRKLTAGKFSQRTVERLCQITQCCRSTAQRLLVGERLTLLLDQAQRLFEWPVSIGFARMRGGNDLNTGPVTMYAVHNEL